MGAMPGHGSLGGQGGRLRLGAERFTRVVCPKAVPEVLTPQPPQGQHDQTGKGFTEETQVSQVQRPGRSDPSAGEEEDLQREAAAAWQRCRALNYTHGLVIFTTAPGGLLSRPGYRPPPEPRGRYSVRPRPRGERQPVPRVGTALESAHLCAHPFWSVEAPNSSSYFSTSRGGEGQPWGACFRFSAVGCSSACHPDHQTRSREAGG